jgi:hypothetical protein
MCSNAVSEISLKTYPWKGIFRGNYGVKIRLFGTNRYISCIDVPLITPYQRSIVYDMAAGTINALAPPGAPGVPDLLGISPGDFHYSGFLVEADVRPCPKCRDLNHPQMTTQAQIDALGGQLAYDAMLGVVLTAIFGKAEW